MRCDMCDGIRCVDGSDVEGERKTCDWGEEVGVVKGGEGGGEDREVSGRVGEFELLGGRENWEIFDGGGMG